MKKKERIITFKVPHDLAEVIKSIPNRSEFIRAAVKMALDSTCPLCAGTGTLSPSQKAHWDDFSRNHKVKRCTECDEIYIECEKGILSDPHS
ncbi:MAG: ribbon-helix-helix domain-containing protein [Syntrophales bacterium]|nr:ribbon-helix-helix domain-containing protein [Syntrophales bacterium]